MVLTVGSYIAKYMPPAEYAPKKASAGLANLVRAHVLAYDRIRSGVRSRSGPFASIPLAVGIAQNMIAFKPDRPWYPIDRILTRVFDRFYNRAFLEAVVGRRQRFGVPGLIPSPPQVMAARGRATADFIGVNYYTKAYVRFGKSKAAEGSISEAPITVSFARPGEPASDLGWSIYPEGFGQMIRLAASYGKPVYITENGIADAADAHRPSYVESHLGEIAKARADGVDVRGYYHWTLMDNFEWIKGFVPRFGLYAVSHPGLERKRTRGAEALARWIAKERPAPLKASKSADFRPENRQNPS
jgi:beta-glucosidase